MAEQRTVLIIEDSESDRFVLRQYLQADSEISYQILETDSAAEGLALCRVQVPDGVLLDIKLPDFDGLEFLTQLKAQTNGNCPPVIVVSGYDDAATVATAFKSGVEDYLVKGQATPEEVRLAMRSAIENVELRGNLQRSEERFRTSIETMLDCLGIYTAVRGDAGQIIDFQIDYFNQAALANHRLTSDVIGKTLSETFPRYCESGVFEEHCRVVETGEPRIKESFAYSDLFGDQDLTQIYDVRSSKLGDGFVSTWRDATDRLCAENQREQAENSLRERKEQKLSGEASQVADIVEDITQRKQWEQEREHLLERERAARAEAEAANSRKDEFLAIVAQELRSPLNSIFGWAQLLQTQLSDQETLTRGLQSIERSAKTQPRLIEDLLDISRMVEGNLSIERVSVNLPFVIESAIEMIRPLAEAKQIQIRSSIDYSTGEVLGDSSRLQQVIWNLLTNAVKFTPTNGQVEITLTPRESQAEICVKDTGKGINASFLPYVLDRFRQAQTNAPRSPDGLGLGLAIVRELIELHNGTVAAESQGEGQGATFTARLPLINSCLLPSASQSGASEGFGSLQVLVVDDEPDSLELVKFVLESEGATVITTASADAAIAAFQQVTPTLIISDIAMPLKDGYQMLREIRALTAGQNIPAIALSAHVSEEVRQQAFAAGYQIHLPKPLEIAQLIEAIGALTQQ